MATDTSNQHAHVIAKDLLIAAIQAKDGIALSVDAAAAADELVTAYKALTKGVREAMRGS